MVHRCELQGTDLQGQPTERDPVLQRSVITSGKSSNYSADSFETNESGVRPIREALSQVGRKEVKTEGLRELIWKIWHLKSNKAGEIGS